MTTPWSQEYAWAFHAAACILWLFAGVGLYIALFRDRSRGRRRCPKCWYDMAGVPGLKCPECGREASKERRLHTTRRRWRLATLFALLAVLGLASFRAPHALRHGFFAAIPIPILNFALSWFPEDAKAAYQVCLQRLNWSPTVVGAVPPGATLTTWDELLASWYAAETVDRSSEGAIRFTVIGLAGWNSRPGIPALRKTAGGVGDTAIPALATLAKLGVAEAREALEHIATTHDRAWVRNKAFTAWCRHSPERRAHRTFLRACLNQTESPSTRELAAKELVQHDILTHSETLDLIGGPDHAAKIGALSGLELRELDNAWAVPALIEALKDPSREVVLAAANSLARLGPRAAAANDALHAAANHPDAAARDAIADAIEMTKPSDAP